MQAQGQLISKVETIVWAIPAPDVNLDQLILILNNQGLPVLEIDRTNNRVQVMYVSEET